MEKVSCAIDGCENVGRLIRGWCTKHYQRWSKHGNPETLIPVAKDLKCEFGDCKNLQRSRRLCNKHYQRWLKYGDPSKIKITSEGCSVRACRGKHRAKSLCVLHYERFRKHGDPLWKPKARHETVPRTCSVDGCLTKGKTTRGWCTKHYSRWLKYGDPEHAKFTTVRGSLKHRLDAKTGFSMYCWEWLGGLDPDGYGHLDRDRGSNRAHRTVFELYKGVIPKGLVVHHKCFNRACVNPMHLEAVTVAVNSQERSGATRISKSGLLGVSWSKYHNRWKVSVQRDGIKQETCKRYLYEFHIAHYDSLVLRGILK